MFILGGKKKLDYSNIGLDMKIAVIYWSGTGNTETMAKSVLEGALASGADAKLFPCGEFAPGEADSFDAFALGCPAMGSEELEDSEFAPFYNALKKKLVGKKVALFGSYGWGGGEWMRTWEADCFDGNPEKACESVIAEESPNDETLNLCKKMGETLAT